MPGPLRLRIRKREGNRRCPYCREQVWDGVTCPLCATLYHPACATELGVCALLGCAGVVGVHVRVRLSARATGRSARFGCLVRLLLLGPALAIVAAFGISRLTVSTHPHTESGAIGALKTIECAQVILQTRDKDGDGIQDYGDLSELCSHYLIDEVLGSGTKSGYLFACRPDPGDPESRWAASADPIQPGKTGDRSFAVNQSGIIYYRVNDGRSAPMDNLADHLPAIADGSAVEKLGLMTVGK